MRRTLFTLAAATSAVLCAAVVVLWVRSYSVEDRVAWRSPAVDRTVRSAAGHVVVGIDASGRWGGSDAPDGRPRFTHSADAPPAPAEVDVLRMYTLSVGPRDTFVVRERGGWAWARWSAGAGGASITRLILPYWAVAGLTAAPAGAWLVGRAWAAARRRRLARAGRCARCGYDLRGSPGRCPECGTAPAEGAT